MAAPGRPLTPREWLRQFNRRVKALKKGIDDTPAEAAEFGALVAQDLAPVDTYTLVQAIEWKTFGGNNKKSAMIYIRPLQRTGTNGLHGRTTWYAQQMHLAWPTFEPRHGHDRYFMFSTRKVVEKKFRSDVRLVVKRFAEDRK